MLRGLRAEGGGNSIRGPAMLPGWAGEGRAGNSIMGPQMLSRWAQEGSRTTSADS